MTYLVMQIQHFVFEFNGAALLMEPLKWNRAAAYTMQNDYNILYKR